MEDNDRRVMLSITGIAGMLIAYLLALTVLTDSGIASRFENGVAPPGFDIVGLRTTVVLSILSAVGAGVASRASGNVFVSALVLMAFVPFVLLSLAALAVAF